MICVEELEQMLSELWSAKRFSGRQVLLAIDGKVLRGTLDEEQNGVYLLAAYLPAEGLVLLEVEVAGKGNEIPTAPKLLKSIDLREKVVMGAALMPAVQITVDVAIWLPSPSMTACPLKFASLAFSRISTCSRRNNLKVAWRNSCG